MSLFTPEESCVDCAHAVFHECCGKFCRCEVNVKIDQLSGNCDSYYHIYEYKADEAMRDQLHIMFPGKLAVDRIVKRCVQMKKKFDDEAESPEAAYSQLIKWIQENVHVMKEPPCADST